MVTTSREGFARRALGYNPGFSDYRDYAMTLEAVRQPKMANLTDKMPPVWDQGQIGSCTAHAAGALVSYLSSNQIEPSRDFLYYVVRAMEHTIKSDSGAMLRDVMKCLAKIGVCLEQQLPYDGSPFPGVNGYDEKRPSESCYQDAQMHRIITYHKISQNLHAMKTAIVQGFPFVFGITAFESIFDDEVTRTGIVPMPASNDAVVGGHALLCVGYSDLDQHFVFRNSWSADWGNAGYGKLPYAYLTDRDLAGDFWTASGMIAGV